MALPKYLTKVTLFSKYLSIILFLLFPFLAFYFGIRYQIMVTPSYPPTQYIPPPEVKIVPHEPRYLTVTVTPAISCRPRPACLDAKPYHCMIAITGDMCPPKNTTTDVLTLDQQTQSAKEQLAQKLSINESLIHVVSAQAINWPDGSLGCPKPGEYYTDSFVSGYQVSLSYDGKNYDYHANTENQPFLCENSK